MNPSIPDKLSTLFDPIFEEATDIAIEEHRVNGHRISVSDGNGGVRYIQPEDITPLAEKKNKKVSASS